MASQENQQEQIPSWHIKADYVEACNCDLDALAISVVK
jgi:hypothetical protein